MNAPGPVRRNDLLDAEFVESIPIARSQVTRIELAPGLVAGLHRHPCHVVGCVLSGAIRFQVAGGDERLLAAGDPFHEPMNAHVLHFDNASPTEPAVFLAFYLLPPGESELIEMLDS
jgi:quercetin dioxygenase-like cupin family protein